MGSSAVRFTPAVVSPTHGLACGRSTPHWLLTQELYPNVTQALSSMEPEIHRHIAGHHTTRSFRCRNCPPPQEATGCIATTKA
ncbi:hypothetical protein GUJ93_ZPchr0007g5125 [Zizania palustris]|uniref:Uncharacterized protein n=1 Tax=Zizania palustris TaxID=103762 RepID=A0A8J5SRN1_ZIZPA|nr:hypothetical protein GUJ93_ZPchr0007g5125 [Zizania palustris]